MIGEYNLDYKESELFEIGKDKVIYKQYTYTGKKYNINDNRGILHIEGKIPYISFKALDNIPYINNGFSTRLGGVSKRYLGNLNLSFSRGDDEDNVRENYRRFAETLDLSEYNFVFSDQVHDTKIRRVYSKDKGKGISCKSDITGIDALITNEKQLTLVTFYADCVPLYFVDTVNQAIGLAHSGWRGTVNRIGMKTIETMKKEFGTDPKNIIGIIGPSICDECYEVSRDVFEEFRKSFSDKVCNEILYENINGKYQLDLWLANKYILMEAGILEKNISISEICTCCNSKLLYSHRASQGRRGNLAAVLSLK